jgi:hypothetical protein
MIPLADWPLRPRAKHGESLAGYVYRLHSDNGHCLSPSAYQLLKACYCAEQPATEFIELNVISGLKALGEDFDPVAWKIACQSFWEFIELQMMVNPPRRTGLQVCPCCIRELGFHLHYWELPLVHACPVHSCALLTHCQRCGQALNWHALQTDWKHKCGQSLLEARPFDAASCDIGIAHWLSRALDAPPCGPAPQDNCLRDRVSMTLRMQYRQLAELKEIRRLVIGELFPIFTHPVHCESRATMRHRRPRLWELRALLAGPIALRHGMRRWARRYLRQLDRDAVPQPLLLRLPTDKAQALDRLKDKHGLLRDPLSDLLNEYALQMPFESHVLFNPRIAEADKAELLRRFRRWWLIISLRVRSQQESRADGDIIIWSADDNERENDAVATLNAVLRISSLNPDFELCVTVFAPLVTELTWCPTDSVEILLLRMAARLMALPDDVFEHLALKSLAMLTQLQPQQR